MSDGVGRSVGLSPARPLIERLRALVPVWETSVRDAKRLAEAQAWMLLAESGIDRPPVPARIIECFPRVTVTQQAGMEHSGRTYWDGKRWVIELATDDSLPRRRMTLFHELKHVIDDPVDESIYQGDTRRREKVADYFAAQVLMPKPWLKRDLAEGIESPEALAGRYGVSKAAMEAQLQEIHAGTRKERA